MGDLNMLIRQWSGERAWRQKDSTTSLQFSPGLTDNPLNRKFFLLECCSALFANMANSCTSSRTAWISFLSSARDSSLV